MATLLPRGKQQFIDANGAPLAGGTVTFYVPGTTTPKDTWQDAGQAVLNTNPVVLDIRGEAVIYGAGSYRQIVKDSLGNLIWDQLTADTSATANSFAGVSAGSANAQTVTASNFTFGSGQTITFFAGYTNTAAMTLAVNGAGALSVFQDGPSGTRALTGGEITIGSANTVIYDATIGAFHLITSAIVNRPPVGEVSFFALSSAPYGWLKANGAAVSRTAYAELFAAIGTTYGSGDGSTTFNLPDLRGEFLRALDDGRGVDTGRVLGSAQAGQNAAHTHGVTDPGHTHSQTWMTSGGTFQGGTTYAAGVTNTGTSTTGITIQSSGGTEARPRNVALLACIKY